MDGERVEELGDGDGGGGGAEECEGEEGEDGYMCRASCCLEDHCWEFDSLREERRICKQVILKDERKMEDCKCPSLKALVCAVGTDLG